MAEINAVPTDAQLNKWEKMRQEGKLGQVVAETKSVVDFSIDREFPELRNDEKARVVKWGRLYVDSAKSNAGLAPDAYGAHSNLKAAKEGIDAVYNHPSVQGFLKTPESKGLLPHTVRDKAKYLTTLTALTGDTIFLSIAVEMLDNVVKAIDDASVKALVNYEAKRLKFRSDPKAFKETQEAYEQSYVLAGSLGDYERASSVSAFYAVDSLVGKKPFEFVKAVYHFGRIMLKDKTNWRALPSQIYKHFTEKERHKKWQETKDPGIDYAKELEIK